MTKARTRRSGWLLIVIGAFFQLFLSLLPRMADLETVPALQNVLQTIYCSADETFMKAQVQESIQQIGYSTTQEATHFFCVNPEQQRDITDLMNLVTTVVFWGTLIVGIGLLIASRSPDPITPPVSQSNVSPPSAAAAAPDRDSLKERMSALQQTYDAGLITRTEYDAARQRLLSGV